VGKKEKEEIATVKPRVTEHSHARCAANHEHLYISYQITRGSDIRNAMHDLAVHCHTDI